MISIMIVFLTTRSRPDENYIISIPIENFSKIIIIFIHYFSSRILHVYRISPEKSRVIIKKKEEKFQES